MRFIVMAAALALAACAASGTAPELDGENSPFPVERGSAPPPPARTSSRQAAPPQGQAPGGMDFGQWRSADPANYGPAFHAQIRQRLAGKSGSEARADLEANGFACENERQLECRIEIFERQCAHDWYVVIERNGAPPIAGYDVMCLGAR